jgi:hypothetical protein
MPAGSTPTRSIAVGPAGDTVLAAGSLGLLRGAPVLRASEAGEGSEAAPAAGRTRRRGDPDIRAVHRASLRYLSLEPVRIAELREGISYRGWLPTVSLRVAAARDRKRKRDYDEAFLSGEMRRLNDRATDKTLDLEGSLVLSWDLGELAFDEDSIDISREARLVISLRDNVLDEINQLYFERRGLLAKLDAPEPPPDAWGVERRAAELAAGLDAWTGGWFSERLERLDTESSTSRESPGIKPLDREEGNHP